LLLRLSIGSGICALLGALIYLLGYLAPPVIRSAEHLLGERWYELELHEQRIGYLHTTSLRDRSGQWQFSSELRFALAAGEPVTMIDQLTFDSIPPYRLRRATHRNLHHDQEDTVTIVRTDDHGTGEDEPRADYAASIRTAGERGVPRSKVLNWQYDLGDYLAFETWLTLTTPQTGAVKIVPTLDFARLDIVAKTYRIVDHNQIGYRVENPAPFDATAIQLDHDYAPVAMDVAGLFRLTRSTRARAMAPPGAPQSASYQIPTDRPLANHTRIARIVLGVHSSRETDILATRSWGNLVREDGGWILTLYANPLSARQPTSSNLEETLNFPVSSERIARLARRAVGDILDNPGRVAALNSYVHRYLTYQPGASAPSVLTLLDRPEGDCTEFADLFTTLARSLNIPARTVFGLAYDGGSPSAFAFHAWNEVSVDGVWQAVDPTWDQLQVDATHIPLPGNQAAALELLTGSVDLRFSVREVDYFADGQG